MTVTIDTVLTREKVVLDFWACVDRIKDEEIKELTNAMLEEAPESFWIAKGSNSGRNHPPENNLGNFGLLVHIVKAVQIAEDSFRFFEITDPYEEDMIRAAIIMHDLYKYGDNGFDFEHGLKCAEKIDTIYSEIHPYILGKIKEWIETHMSRWTHPLESMKKFIFQDKGQLIVALADYYSSRNQISFYPGLSILGGTNEQRKDT